jgi:hypothetical protein
MLSHFWKYRRAVVALIAIWIVFECMISWSAFCHQADNYGVHYQATKENRCVFRGPTITAVQNLGASWERIFDKPDAYVALFTAVLAVSTIALWQSNEKMWAVTKIAADAADRSARASISLQLPIIRIAPDKLGHGETKMGRHIIEEVSVANVVISNLGATKAFPTELLYGWVIGDTLPDEPRYTWIDRFPVNLILEANPNITPFKRLNGAAPIQPDDWTKICAGNYLWFFCSLLYEDFMAEKHSHGFCWRWTNTGGGMGWRAEDRPSYNRKI